MQLSCIRRTLSVVAVAAGLSAGAAWAVDPFVVRDIRVEGLQRVEAGTIFASLPVRVGDTYEDGKGAAAIQALFGLGLFKDVRIEVSGNVLVVIVEERPTVADIEFSGNKEFEKDVLRNALRDAGLADGRPFDKAVLDRAEQELKRQYINRSFYATEVVTTVTPVERNRVNLSFTVVEGERAAIKEIRVVGNKAFRVQVETAQEMLQACELQLPADIAVCTAAVADWRVDGAAQQKIKKSGGKPPSLHLVENPDILHTLSHHPKLRPSLVVGFAAETENVTANAELKRQKKSCDWVVANDVSPATGVMGGDENTVHIIERDKNETWPKLSKQEVADRLADRIAQHFSRPG